MGVKWRDFQLPKFLIIDQESYTNTYGKFVAEPFERGYGVTLGNALRRVLMSSIEGASITSVKIEGVSHEFSTIEGVLEDLPEIILNLKEVVLKSTVRQPKKITIKKDKKGDVKAGDIETDGAIEVINPDHYICALTEDKPLVMEMEVAMGRGWAGAEQNKKEEQVVGVIPIDSIFTPVKKVAVDVEQTRVGKRTDYDKIILQVWTNGSMEPKDALLHAVTILKRHFDIFTQLGTIEEIEEEEELTPEERSLYEKLSIPVSELELSVRSSNCLREASIKILADLVQKSEEELMGYRNFGRKSLSEITELLKGMGLSLGMEIDKEKLNKV